MQAAALLSSPGLGCVPELLYWHVPTAFWTRAAGPGLTATCQHLPPLARPLSGPGRGSSPSVGRAVSLGPAVCRRKTTRATITADRKLRREFLSNLGPGKSLQSFKNCEGSWQGRIPKRCTKETGSVWSVRQLSKDRVTWKSIREMGRKCLFTQRTLTAHSYLEMCEKPKQGLQQNSLRQTRSRAGREALLGAAGARRPATPRAWGHRAVMLVPLLRTEVLKCQVGKNRT